VRRINLETLRGGKRARIGEMTNFVDRRRESMKKVGYRRKTPIKIAAVR
jgi:hypothetical protein